MSTDTSHPTSTETSQRTDSFERLHTLSEVAKNYFQILALAAAGLWVLFRFGVQDWPSREAQFNVDSVMAWEAGPSPPTCFGDWSISITNTSTRRVRVRRADVRIWAFRAPAAVGEKPAFVDLRRLKPRDSSKHLFTGSFTDRSDPIVGSYPPKGTFSHTFEWVFAREPKDQWLVFEVELFADDLATRSLWSFSEWSQRCSP